jgi:hypothetical protein
VQPVDACGTPRDRTFWTRVIGQLGDGSAHVAEQLLILTADARQVAKRRLPEDNGQAHEKLAASIRPSAVSRSSRLTPLRPAALSAMCAASAALSSRSAKSSMLISAATGLPSSLMVDGGSAAPQQRVHQGAPEQQPEDRP